MEKISIEGPLHPSQVWVPPRTTPHDPSSCNIRKTNSHTLGAIKYTGFTGYNNGDNDKEDIIKTQLEQYAIALRILSKYPEAMNDFRLSIGVGAIQ